ncbi:GNAT family N-acetyltransferase [Altererythrobacter indicus]|uniref:GNAT family N-acetyltransferase n=1 Tax=Altericroceibacterium indicum TaxID=374177 RepID=A0A845A5A8_9SPHN|nr:GNAT family N-acetyltransferase [Altericroceibacterium indicum]MXP24453.1 GNAT family N-acetyltransferase [Altericroceibacterium indicum]
MHTPALQWRLMTVADLPQVCALADAIHQDYPEGAEIFAERLALYPHGCFMLAGAEGGFGYAISHPWTRGRPVPLNQPLGALPEAADVYYLHDLALAPQARGQGAGGMILNHLHEWARSQGLCAMVLVAVGNAGPFWEGQGFEPRMDEAMAQKLAQYGGPAIYMEKAISPAI